MALFGGDLTLHTRYGALVVEEAAGAFSRWCCSWPRDGSKPGVVDAAIYGFALGTGFAVVENAIYINAPPDATPFVWVVRACTATTVGGATAICVDHRQDAGGSPREAAAAAPAAPDAARRIPPAWARGGAAALAATFCRAGRGGGAALGVQPLLLLAGGVHPRHPLVFPGP